MTCCAGKVIYRQTAVQRAVSAEGSLQIQALALHICLALGHKGVSGQPSAVLEIGIMIMLPFWTVSQDT